MAHVSCQDVNKTFGDGTRAVRDLDLQVADGEFMVLVGPSGCGKSTTLRMIAGLEEVSAGEIHIGERCVNELPPQARNIAMVFQNYALYPHKTVFENIAFPLRMARGRQRLRNQAIAERVQATAGMLELTPWLQRKPAALSGGQRQRVAMARALIREPAVFLLDEPLSNLDAKLRVQMRSEIASLQRRTGTTTVYVTHDQVEAMTMGDRVAVFDHGVLQQVDTPQKLFQRPRNTFVATFIGSPSMSICASSLRRDGDALQVTMAGHTFQLPASFRQRHALSAELDQIQLGLRPEDVLPADAVPAEQRLQGVVDACEVLGREQMLYLHCGALRLGARLPAEHRFQPGEQATVGIDWSRVYGFDADGTSLLQSSD